MSIQGRSSCLPGLANVVQVSSCDIPKTARPAGSLRVPGAHPPLYNTVFFSACQAAHGSPCPTFIGASLRAAESGHSPVNGSVLCVATQPRSRVSQSPACVSRPSTAGTRPRSPLAPRCTSLHLRPVVLMKGGSRQTFSPLHGELTASSTRRIYWVFWAGDSRFCTYINVDSNTSRGPLKRDNGTDEAGYRLTQITCL